MSVITEFIGSRESTVGVSESSFHLHYHVHGTEDDLEVHTAVQAVLTPVARGLVFQSYTIRHMGNGVWEVQAVYGQRSLRGRLPSLKEGDQPKKIGPEHSEGFTFDTTGGTRHITNSKETVARHGPKKSFDIPIIGPRTFEIVPPDMKGAIGVTADGVDGADITVPVLQFTETHYKLVSEVDGDYIGALFALTGCMNNNPWRIFEAGEVLFLGVSGSQRNQLVAELTFRFLVEYNETFLEIGQGDDLIIVPSKYGHDYLWVRYEDEVDTEQVTAEEGDAEKEFTHYVRRPKGVYIERVYPFGDFLDLQIGP